MTHTNDDEATDLTTDVLCASGQVRVGAQARAQFENWMINTAKIAIGSTDPYPAGLERAYWQVWQAALASRATPTAQEVVAVMRQWPDPLTSDMARALEQHRESLLVEIMSMFDQMQRQLDYSRGGKLGPVDPPQPSASVAEVAQKVSDLWDNGCHDISWRGHFDGAMTNLKAALRALKGDE